MTKKILSSIILITIILAGIIIPKIYADNSTVSIPNTKVKQGEQLKVYINVENIKSYTISKINLTTDVYLEPVLDIANTGMTSNNAKFDNTNKVFTIGNIPSGVKTICVIYTIPTYIANGTKINLSYSIIDDQDQEQEKNVIEITVMSDEVNKEEQNNQNNQNQPNTDVSNNQNNANTRKSKSDK